MISKTLENLVNSSGKCCYRFVGRLSNLWIQFFSQVLPSTSSILFILVFFILSSLLLSHIKVIQHSLPVTKLQITHLVMQWKLCYHFVEWSLSWGPKYVLFHTLSGHYSNRHNGQPTIHLLVTVYIRNFNYRIVENFGGYNWWIRSKLPNSPKFFLPKFSTIRYHIVTAL